MASSINASTTSGLVQTADTSGVLQLQTANTTAVTVDASQNVGIGVTTPADKLQVNGSSNTSSAIRLTNQNTNVGYISNYASFIGSGTSNDFTLAAIGALNMVLATNGSERMRITSGGDLFLNTTATFSYANGKMCINADGSGNPGLVVGVNSTSSAYNNIVLGNSTGGVGRIQTNGSATSYLTSSDHRLKTNVAPIQNAIATIQRLNPVAFTWTVDNREDAGFLAHEFQEVLPNYADGTKDEVDAEGNPIYQAVDKSGAIPYLVKAIQEQQELIKQLQADVAELKGV